MFARHDHDLHACSRSLCFMSQGKKVRCTRIRTFLRSSRLSTRDFCACFDVSSLHFTSRPGGCLNDSLTLHSHLQSSAFLRPACSTRTHTRMHALPGRRSRSLAPLVSLSRPWCRHYHIVEDDDDDDDNGGNLSLSPRILHHHHHHYHSWPTRAAIVPFAKQEFVWDDSRDVGQLAG